MKHNSLFELNSTFESASVDGTLAYPNLSLIEENGEVASHKLRQIKFYIKRYYENKTVEFVADEGMTWGEWIDSSYNTLGYHLTISACSQESNAVAINEEYTIQYVISDTYMSCDTIQTKDMYITEGLTYNEYYNCCFVAGTQVTMADGSLKNIEDIVASEYVKSYNVETGEIYDVYVKNTIVNPYTIDILTVTLEDGTVLKMNEYHPLYTRTGWHSHTNHNGYDTLVIGDEVKTYEGWSKIVDMSLEHTNIVTYNLNVCDSDDIEQTKDGENDNFFANGVVAHNAACPI